MVFLPIISLAQTGTLTGLLLNEDNFPLEDVNIKTIDGGTKTDKDGFFSLKIPANTDVTVVFTHLSHKPVTATFNLKNGETYVFNPVMSVSIEQIEEVVLNSRKRKDIEGIVTLDTKALKKIPGASAGVENILKTLPGVSGNNELSTQYSVRGGNYDENLVYVNGIEVYKPFLVRSGQQEGLSFVNSDLVKNIEFSAGGFQAKYGDKLSSVLDITYKKPIDFAVSADLSLLGGSVAVESASNNSKFTSITGIRYRDNSLLVNAKETETNFNPAFFDIQTYLTYKFSDKFQLSFLGNGSINKYDYEPQTRQTNFGTLDDPLALLVFYEGQERDRYQTLFGALNGTYYANDNLTLDLVASTYHTVESEYFDILAEYRLGEVNSNIGDEDLGEVEFSEGIGGQLNHGRNDIDALISTIEQKGTYTVEENEIKWSVKYTNEDIRDRLIEWEVIDSAGFSIRPPTIDDFNDQPYTPYDGPIEPFQNIRAKNETQINRFQTYVQWSKRGTWGNSDVWYNAGVRAHNWSVTGEGLEKNYQTVVSPRAQLAIKPDWKKDMLFRVSTGLYYQPPFYRELRDRNGDVQPNVDAQQSIHLVLGNDYSFDIWERPFKLTSEVYYKDITDVNSYTVENVRIRYRANNNAEAYAYGLDLRLNGEFVPGTESWFSFGYLKTEENLDNRGFIARPTDQRLKFAALFQDYVPKIPSMKMYLNLVYNTGLPGGSPSYADPYVFQNFRLPDYKRADVGFQFVAVDANKTYNKRWKQRFKELSFGVEIFNVFDVQNSITNTWVRDVYTKRQFAIPNFLTPRVFNVRTTMRF